MYHPYFRGKQNELITIRETAHILAVSGFVPIIEPVKEALNGLKRTLDAVVEAGGKAVVITNPFHGDFSSDGEDISMLMAEHFAEAEGISVGILLKGNMTTTDVQACCDSHASHSLSLIHAGFSDAKGLADALGEQAQSMRHVFFEPDSGKLHQKHFKNNQRVLIRDGFQRRKNREHPEVELFSDLHATFKDEGMDGFGDFLIVGDDYSETGGPAYAIAIHLTYIDDDKDEAMYVYHFVSTRQDTPKDPAGKFAEALEKMIQTLDKSGSKVLESKAVQEFRKLHARRHFPGLGYIKKLSMQHHIETLHTYFKK
ncbi:sce7725 family protein [Nitrosospira briensis]|uniref:sce7725 family protein n=1 Tax=Nitrosospira briensis TaxID=35799 RepID=UPI00046A3DF9|nr:sce7725 family protein [Nitrosospira briensis]